MSSYRATNNIPALPAGFESLKDIDDMDAARLTGKPLVKLIGVVTDTRTPIKTKNGNVQLTLTLIRLDRNADTHRKRLEEGSQDHR